MPPKRAPADKPSNTKGAKRSGSPRITADNTARNGKIIAGFLLAGACISIGTLMWLNRGGPRQSGVDIEPIEPPDPRGSAVPLAGGGVKGFIAQIADRDDPTKTRAELRAESLDPTGTARYSAVSPRAVYYLADGAVMHVSAAAAEVQMAGEDDRVPRNGVLSGGVRVRYFAPRADGSRANPDVDQPDAQFESASLRFDETMGEIATDDAIVGVLRGTSGVYTVKGRGLSVFLNEPEQRINRLRIAEGESIVFEPLKPASTSTGNLAESVTKPGVVSPTRQQPANGGAQQPDDGPRAINPTTEIPIRQPDIVEYAISILDEVKILRGGSIVDADLAQAWVRLIDNALPQNAIASAGAPADSPVQPRAEQPETPVINPGIARDPSNTPAQPRDLAAKADDNSASPTTLSAATNSEPFEVRWTGELVVVPVSEANDTDRLAQDHVSVRLTGARRGGVDAQDGPSGATLHADLIDYWATRGIMHLESAGDLPEVKIEAPGSGSALMRSLHADIVNGRAEILGAGGAVAGEGGQRVTWADGGTLRFADISGSTRLRGALFRGGVSVGDEGGMITGDTLDASFTEAPDGATLPTSMTVVGSAHAQDDQSGSIDARELFVEFAHVLDSSDDTGADVPEPDGAQEPQEARAPKYKAVPAYAAADGDVSGERAGEAVRGDIVEAWFATDDGSSSVTRAELIGAARYERTVDGEEPLSASADAISLDAAAGSARLIASGAQPARVASGGSGVSGRDITLDRGRRSINVEGAGEFEQVDPETAVRTAFAQWSRSMSYSDTTGTLDADGSVSANSWSIDELSESSITAGRVMMQLAPVEHGATADAAGEGDDPVALPSISKSRREVVSARVWGDATDPRHSPAKILTKTFAAESPDTVNAEAPGARKPIQLAYVESNELIVEERTDLIRSPGRGRLILMDKRASEAHAEEGVNSLVSTRGSSSFDWRGGMIFDRRASTAGVDRLADSAASVRITDDAEVLHVRQEDGRQVKMEARSIRAELIDDAAADAGAPNEQPDDPGSRRAASGLSLRLLDAEGSVFLASRSGGAGQTESQPTEQKLSAEHVTYDATTGVATATGTDAWPANFLESQRATPVYATKIIWNLLTGRFEAEGIRTISGPR